MTDEEVQALQNELETTRTELEGIKAEKETLTAELESKVTFIATLEQAAADRVTELSDRETEVNALKLAHEEIANNTTILNQSLSNAVSAYKTIIAQAHPSVPSELITGDTIEAINQSLENANSIVTKVREAVKAEISSASVPAGAPARSAPDLDSLSPREKIEYAITKGGKK